MASTTFDISQVPGNQINILDNAGFEIWQRGITFNSAVNAQFTADRWFLNTGGTAPTVNITQESSVVDSGLYSLKMNITSPNGANSCDMIQTVENYQAYKGRTLTFSMRVNATVGVNICLYDGVGFTFSSPHPGDGAYHTLTVTRTISSSATLLQVLCGFLSGLGGSTAPSVSITYFDSAMLVLGPNPASFVPMNPMLDLARCQRYYEITNVNHQVMTAQAIYTGGTNTSWEWNRFKVTKRAVPTITITYTGAFGVQSPSQGSGSSNGDTAAWSVSAGNTDTDSWNAQFHRNAVLTTYNMLEVDYYWTASADL